MTTAMERMELSKNEKSMNPRDADGRQEFDYIAKPFARFLCTARFAE